ncbi:glycosyltransferase [Serratia sp. CY52157]|uniref:glycosyltransferase n=1 Tax=Serratia TaxID=613 RepID=UPI0004F5A299|nr:MULTISPECIES: glycosyltransferase [Serratia]WIF05229.1 glycosyltransferase [Serratia sp. B1]AIM21133.1 glycosyltransferase [Serratia sp. SCBI]MBH2718893.1 glycosyltransferase [Serratia ureilytica]MBJ2104174.1 glycosyltransferase [Serratia ureilytica]MBS7518932.1 glycosyltransferase [Serratia ureilytica]
MTAKLSIIVTSYNIEKYIGECLDNVLAQTLEDIEIIVVDDGSKDSTPKIIESYAEKDKRIIPILMKENSPGGVATVANIGMEAATGEFIGFADGDDLYDPTMFEKLYNIAVAENADVAMCNFLEFETETGIENAPYEPAWATLANKPVWDIRSVENKKKVLELLPVPWRKIYKRKLITDNNLKFPVGKYFFEDNGFHWFVTLTSDKVCFIDEVLCYHRRNRAGQTMMAGGDRLLGVFLQHQVIFDYLEKSKMLAQYREYSLNWLVGHIAWVSQVLTPTFSTEFYETLLPHVKRYQKGEIQSYLSTRFYDRKTVGLVIALMKESSADFSKVMNGWVAKTKAEKLRFNYDKLGPGGLLNMLVRIGKHKFIERGLHRKSTRALLIENNARLDSIHWRLSELERMIESGFILQEQRIAEIKKQVEEIK